MGWQRSFLVPQLVPRNGAHCSSGRRRPAPVAPVLVLQPVRPCPRPGPGALRSTSHALALLSDREGSSSRLARTVRFAEPSVHQCNIHLLGSRGKPARRGRQSHLAVQFVAFLCSKRSRSPQCLRAASSGLTLPSLLNHTRQSPGGACQLGCIWRRSLYAPRRSSWCSRSSRSTSCSSTHLPIPLCAPSLVQLLTCAHLPITRRTRRPILCSASSPFHPRRSQPLLHQHPDLSVLFPFGLPPVRPPSQPSPSHPRPAISPSASGTAQLFSFATLVSRSKQTAADSPNPRFSSTGPETPSPASSFANPDRPKSPPPPPTKRQARPKRTSSSLRSRRSSFTRCRKPSGPA